MKSQTIIDRETERAHQDDEAAGRIVRPDDARQARIILDRPWRLAVFIGGLAALFAAALVLLAIANS